MVALLMDTPRSRTRNTADDERIAAIAKEIGDTKLVIGGKEVTAKEVLEAGVRAYTKDVQPGYLRLVRVMAAKINLVVRPKTEYVQGGLQPEDASYIRTLVKYGMSPKEVAKTMGLSEDLVKSVSKPKLFSWARWTGRKDRKRAMDV